LLQGSDDFTTQELADLRTEQIMSGTMPVFLIDGKAYSYTAAMKILRSKE